MNLKAILRYAALCLVLPSLKSEASLMAGPEIISVGMDPDNPDVIYLDIKGRECEAAVSRDGGTTFQVVARQEIPKHLITTMTLGSRRYVLHDGYYLFRSDDAGATWVTTSASSFLREQYLAAAEQEKKRFEESYGSRLPERSSLWVPVFIFFSCLYALIVVLSLRSKGWLVVIGVFLRGWLILSLVYCLLTGIHDVVLNWTSTQYPKAYWNTSAAIHPGSAMGIVMKVAALPLPLMAYLLALWPILPGSLEVLGGLDSSRTMGRRRAAILFSVVVGVFLTAFHLCLIFGGHLFER